MLNFGWPGNPNKYVDICRAFVFYDVIIASVVPPTFVIERASHFNPKAYGSRSSRVIGYRVRTITDLCSFYMSHVERFSRPAKLGPCRLQPLSSQFSPLHQQPSRVGVKVMYTVLERTHQYR